MKIIGDDEGVGIYFQGELETSLLVSLLERHINLSVKESLYNKGIFQEEREMHPTEYVARSILDGMMKGQDGEN